MADRVGAPTPMDSIWDSEGRTAPRGLPPNAVYADPVKGAAEPTGPFGVRVNDKFVQSYLMSRGLKGPYTPGYDKVPLKMWQMLSAQIKNRNDLALRKGLTERYGIKELPPGVAAPASELAYQTGPEGALKFKKSWPLVREFLSAPREQGVDPVINEFKDSLWYKQTPKRADKVLENMRSGLKSVVPKPVATQEPEVMNKQGSLSKSAAEAFKTYMGKKADLGDPMYSGIESISGKVSGKGGEPGVSPLQTAGPQSRLPIKVDRTNKGVDTSQTGGILGTSGNSVGGGPSAQL